MSSLKAYKYRLYSTKKQAEKLQEVLDRCRELYNAALQERRDAYRMAHVGIGYNQQAAQLPEIKRSGQNMLTSILRYYKRRSGAWIKRSRRFFAASKTEKSLDTRVFKATGAMTASRSRNQVFR